MTMKTGLSAQTWSWRRGTGIMSRFNCQCLEAACFPCTARTRQVHPDESRTRMYLMQRPPYSVPCKGNISLRRNGMLPIDGIHCGLHLIDWQNSSHNVNERLRKVKNNFHSNADVLTCILSKARVFFRQHVLFPDRKLHTNLQGSGPDHVCHGSAAVSEILF
jgi:hypothetical protein